MNSNIRISVISSLYRCAQYLEEYFLAVQALEKPENTEILLLHNDPTEAELQIIESWKSKVSVQLRHIIIPEREGLYRTWNRGVKLAQGEFLAIWNVDDQRSAGSLQAQAECLDQNPNAVLCYGSYIGVQRFAAREGELYRFPDFQPQAFLRSCFLSPFPLWRASLHKTIGYFDEAYRSAGDYDFQLRAARSAAFVRLDAIAGYYLEAPESGISKSGDINNIERTVCEIRYAIYDKLNLLYIGKAWKYSWTHMRWDNTKAEISSHFHGLGSYRALRLLVLPLSLLRLPINILRYIKHRVLPRILANKTQQSTQHQSQHSSTVVAPTR